MHVVQTPGIGHLLAHRVHRPRGEVLTVPGVAAQQTGIVTKGAGRLGACAGRVFPLGLGWQPVTMSAFALIEPLDERLCIVP